MRDIRFRAWNKEASRFTHFDLAFVLSDLAHNPEPVERRLNMFDMPIQQATGLKDKNGKEIYEGDILQHDLWKIPVKVFWEYGGFMAQSVTGELGKKSYTDGSLYDMQLPKCKVIGNIYENKELLK